jgi:hypothetical protein
MKLKFIHVIKKETANVGFKSHRKTLSQYLCIALTAMATVYIGNNMELIS